MIYRYTHTYTTEWCTLDTPTSKCRNISMVNHLLVFTLPLRWKNACNICTRRGTHGTTVTGVLCTTTPPPTPIITIIPGTPYHPHSQLYPTGGHKQQNSTLAVPCRTWQGPDREPRRGIFPYRLKQSTATGFIFSRSHGLPHYR